MAESSPIPRPILVLVSSASLVIIVAGLKAAGDIILPLLFAVFLSILVWPLVTTLMRLRIPRPLAILTALLLVAAAMVGGTAIVTDSIAGFTSSIPTWQEPMEAEVARLNALLARHELGRELDLAALIQPSSLLAAVRAIAVAIAGILSNVVLVLLAMAFILLEASDLGTKVEIAFGQVPGRSWAADAGERVQRYLGIKTVASAATGLLLGVFVGAMGLSFPVLWGLIAFVLNFVPAVGSIIAAVPAVALAIVELGLGKAALVALGYLAVNFTIGNLIEPRVLGRKLGLSPFVVILSLLFWGYVWGPGGTLLGVPLTVIAKLVLESSPNTRWLAMMLAGATEAQAIAREDEQRPELSQDPA